MCSISFCFLYGHPIPPLGAVSSCHVPMDACGLRAGGPPPSMMDSSNRHTHTTHQRACNKTGYLGLTIVFASIGYRIKRKTEGASPYIPILLLTRGACPARFAAVNDAT